MAFDKKTWANNQGGGTPLDASGLNDLESRIADSIDELDIVAGLVGLGGIVESGSNANGRFIRLESGDMIVYRRATKPANTGYLDLTMPYPFIDTNFISIITNQYTNTAIVFYSANPISNNVARIYSYRDLSGNNTNVDVSFSYIAIGRWK